MKIKEHPMVGILGAAARRLIVLEAQLPVPAPVAGYSDRYWARVRVALRDDQDLERLEQFLRVITNSATAHGNPNGRIVMVQVSPAGGKRILAEPIEDAAQASRHGRRVLASDMDVANGYANKGTDARGWRILAICADARSNIDYNIMRRLAQVEKELELVGLTYALLHGTAVVLLLCHESGESAGQHAGLQDMLRNDPALAKVRVAVNERCSREELGEPGKYPLLRVHFRSQDRPGGLLDVLNSLGATLTDPDILPQFESGYWQVWHAQTQVTAGYAASTRLTVRLQTNLNRLKNWDESTFEEIGRKVRTRAIRAAAVSSSSLLGDELLGNPETPVISVGLIEAPPRIVRFRLNGEVSSANLSAIQPLLKQFSGGQVSLTPHGMHVEGVMKGTDARSVNHRLLSALRRVEKRTNLRAEWSADDTIYRFFDYVLESQRPA